MSSKTKTCKSTKDYLEKIRDLKNLIQNAEAILVGAGAGLSTSAGFDYSGQRFEDLFSDFRKKYGITDMYSGGFYPFETLEEYWAYWSRFIYYNRYVDPPRPVYERLYNLLRDKNYFVLTTNVDHVFQRANFDKSRLFYTQGDFGLWQCSIPCHKKTYDNKDQVLEMVKSQDNMKIPSNLIPYCPKCSSPMTMNLRADETFVQDLGWEAAFNNYKDFVQANISSNILFFELGVGPNTPGIIKYPFWQMTRNNPKSSYACLNLYQAKGPDQIDDQALYIEADIGQVLDDLLKA